MLLFLAFLVAGGVISGLMAGVVYYGWTGLVELLEAALTVLVFVLCYIRWRLGGGPERAKKERRRRAEDTRSRFANVSIRMDDGRVLQPGSYTFDEHGIPVLPE